VVVADLDVIRITVAEHEANPPLVVDRYGVLSGTIALECMEAIARRNPQALDLVGRVESRELSECSAFDFRGQTSRAAGGPEPLCVPVRERSDHG
jgi:hypothetical protein